MPLRGRTPVRTAPHPVHLCTHAQTADPCARTPRLTQTHARAQSLRHPGCHSHPMEGHIESHGHTVTASQPRSEHAHTFAHTHSHTRSWIQAHGSHTAAHLITRCPRPMAHALHQSRQRSAGLPHMPLGQARQGDTTSHLGLEDPSGPEKGVRVQRPHFGTRSQERRIAQDDCRQLSLNPWAPQ